MKSSCDEAAHSKQLSDGQPCRHFGATTVAWGNYGTVQILRDQLHKQGASTFFWALYFLKAYFL
jgi:hypothetical protein